MARRKPARRWRFEIEHDSGARGSFEVEFDEPHLFAAHGHGNATLFGSRVVKAVPLDPDTGVQPTMFGDP